MGTKARDSSSITLQNGVSVKGSYTHSLGGVTYYKILILSKNAQILAHHNLSKHAYSTDALEFIQKQVSRVAATLQKYRIDTLAQERIQMSAAQYVIRVLFPSSAQVSAA